jgi:hypothetical protein
LVIGGDDDFSEGRSFFTLFDDVLNEGFAGDGGDGFGGETRRGVAGRDDSDNSHWGLVPENWKLGMENCAEKIGRRGLSVSILLITF